MDDTDRPNVLIWDMTFACPLRCYHCYTESGRRPARSLAAPELMKVADALISLGAELITLCGGEPLTLRPIVEVARRLRAGGLRVYVYTSGWNTKPALLDQLAGAVDKIVVSVDGPDAATHDRIRGRAGSFEHCMRTLGLLNDRVEQDLAAGRTPLRFGIDYVVVRSNYDQLDRMCAEVVPRFSSLETLSFGAVVPTGLASRPSFVEQELVSDEQAAELILPATRERLRAAAPAWVEVDTTDNFEVQMNPKYLADNPDFRPMEIEPDGAVRGMPIYEGTVGSLLTEDPVELWRRSRARWTDPFVLDCLSRIHTRRDWAEAIRQIDRHFGTPEVRARIDARPALVL
ncbi:MULTISPECIES: radical SAM protein [unclassified Crossiella]|uniref:radical SAM protein n=1 Tax=unclassified Crossiella TaxID=2620835 RepID=UPI001FFFFA8E|nr:MULTISPECIES: radical SAM protein [unclassified Crossiella]MCK2240629.1 radical SAM protein [Crossiella sp. S99.2]MCK2252920.1 radical SAM protein [Crossiella sp. S99.1]